MKFKVLTNLFLSLVVAESRFEADFLLSFSEDLIRIADRDFFVSAILASLLGEALLCNEILADFLTRGGVGK